MYKRKRICFLKSVAILLLIGLLPAAEANGQTTVSSAPPAITFQRNYTVANQEYAYGMDQTSDSGFVVAGQMVKTTAPFIFDTYIQRTDKYGNVAWCKAIGPSGFVIDRAFGVQQTSTGQFIVSG